MRSFPLKIITPSGVQYDGETQRAVFRTTEGDVGILYGHADYTAMIESGGIRILDDTGEQSALCKNGVVIMRDNTLTILASDYKAENETQSI